jgi:cytochrome P450
MKPYTFANGITVPKGVTVVTPQGPHQMDDNVYENASEFDGLRFNRAREQNEESARFYTTNTSTDHLIFGHGRHAWYLPESLAF